MNNAKCYAWIGRILSLSLLVLFVFFLAKYLDEIKQAFLHVQLSWLWLLIVLQFLMIALSGYNFQVLSQPFQFNLRWTDWMGLSFIANFVNHLLPYRPGLAIRYVYLKHKYAMPLKTYLWIMGIYLILTCLTAGFFSLIGWVAGKLYIIPVRSVIIMILMITGLLSLAYITRKLSGRKTDVTDPQVNNHGPISTLLLHSIEQPTTLIFSLLVFCLIYFIISGTFYCVFLALQFMIPFSHCMFIAGIISIASLIPITAANIGVNESLLGAITQLIYQDFSIGFSASLIYRMSQWIPGFILGGMFSFYLLGNIFPWKQKSINAHDLA